MGSYASLPSHQPPHQHQQSTDDDGRSNSDFRGMLEENSRISLSRSVTRGSTTSFSHGVSSGGGDGDITSLGSLSGLKDYDEHIHHDLAQVKLAWRAFERRDLGSKLSLGMTLTNKELDYLKFKLQNISPRFRPIKLHFWDNTAGSCTGNTNNNSNSMTGAAAGFDCNVFALCQISVRHVEFHGFGGAPPLSSPFCYRFSQLSHLDSVRLYHLNLTGLGHELQSIVLSSVRTLYVARCTIDVDTLRDIDLSRLRRLRKLTVVHCQFTDDMLKVILDSLAATEQQQQQHQQQDVIEPAGLDFPDPLLPGAVDHDEDRNMNEREELQHEQRQHPLRAPIATEDEHPCLELLVHGNDLTVRSIGLLAEFLSSGNNHRGGRRDLLRSVTLHANPQIDALLTHDQLISSSPEWEQFLDVIQTQAMSLRHFSWHGCCQTSYYNSSSTTEGEGGAGPGTANTNDFHCEACWEMQQSLSRNRWLALTKKLALAIDTTPSRLWPLLLYKLMRTESWLPQQRQHHLAGTNCERPSTTLRRGPSASLHVSERCSIPPTADVSSKHGNSNKNMASVPVCTALFSLIRNRPFGLEGAS